MYKKIIFQNDNLLTKIMLIYFINELTVLRIGIESFNHTNDHQMKNWNWSIQKSMIQNRKMNSQVGW